MPTSPQNNPPVTPAHVEGGWRQINTVMAQPRPPAGDDPGLFDVCAAKPSPEGWVFTPLAQRLQQSLAEEIAVRCNLHIWMVPAMRHLLFNLRHGNGLADREKTDANIRRALDTAAHGPAPGMGSLIAQPRPGSPDQSALYDIGSLSPECEGGSSAFVPVASGLSKVHAEEITRRCGLHPRLVEAMSQLRAVSHGAQLSRDAVLQEADAALTVAESGLALVIEQEALRTTCPPPEIAPAQPKKADVSVGGE